MGRQGIALWNAPVESGRTNLVPRWCGVQPHDRHLPALVPPSLKEIPTSLVRSWGGMGYRWWEPYGHRTGKVSFHFNHKGNAKEWSNYRTIALISHTSKVMLKICQARLQQYVNWEPPDIQAGFRQGRRTKDQIANIHWVIEKAREFQKNMYYFNDYAKASDCVNHNKLWKILGEMVIPDPPDLPPEKPVCRSRSSS